MSTTNFLAWLFFLVVCSHVSLLHFHHASTAAALNGDDSKALGRVCVNHFYRVAGARLKICYLNSTKCVSSLSHTFSGLERTNVNP